MHPIFLVRMQAFSILWLCCRASTVFLLCQPVYNVRNEMSQNCLLHLRPDFNNGRTTPGICMEFATGVSLLTFVYTAFLF
jgi:hypothetical protein